MGGRSLLDVFAEFVGAVETAVDIENCCRCLLVYGCVERGLALSRPDTAWLECLKTCLNCLTQALM